MNAPHRTLRLNSSSMITLLSSSAICLLLGACDPGASSQEFGAEFDPAGDQAQPGATGSLGLQSAGGPEQQPTSLTATTPNILFVIADDVGVDNISAYDEHDQSANTANIDSLAADGVLFRNTWVNPMCSPSRASLLTGRHAFRHGLLHPAGSELDTDEDTVAEILQTAGYATALFGKWHLGTSTGTTPAEQGFDHFSGALSGNISDYFEWTKTTQEFVDGNLEETTVTETDYATSVNVAEAEAWITEQSSPWMVTMAFNAGHSPFHVPPSDLHSRTLSGVEGDACGANEADPSAKCFRAMVEAMDSEIGGLLDWLDSAGELDNTLVIFIGDNGTAGSVVIDDGVFATDHAKTTVYEGGVNVPFIVYGPGLGVLQGTEIGDIVQGLDVFSTILEVANGTSTASVIDSQSLLDYLTDGAVADPRSFLYTELYSDSQAIDRWAVTNGTVKYFYSDADEACFNLNLDPGESSDKYGSNSPASTVCDHLSTLRPCDDTDECPG